MKPKVKYQELNIYRIIWISCIFIILIIILIMLADYKINYQYLKESKLYFYDCNGELCTTEVKEKNKKPYSKYDCKYEVCPKYIKQIRDDYVLLELKNNIYELYDYKKGETISSGYDSYTFIDNKYIIVSQNNKYGIIDTDDNIVVSIIYELIGHIEGEALSGYNTENIIAVKKDKYGIINYKSGQVIVQFNLDSEELALENLNM